MKAVIETGGKQYLVAENETLEVEKLKNTEKGKISFQPILVLDPENGVTNIGKPVLNEFKVEAEIIELEKKTDKVTSIRYKAKKRVKTVRGHRQIKSVIKIKKISTTK